MERMCELISRIKSIWTYTYIHKDLLEFDVEALASITLYIFKMFSKYTQQVDSLPLEAIKFRKVNGQLRVDVTKAKSALVSGKLSAFLVVSITDKLLEIINLERFMLEHLIIGIKDSPPSKDALSHDVQKSKGKQVEVFDKPSIDIPEDKSVADASVLSHVSDHDSEDEALQAISILYGEDSFLDDTGDGKTDSCDPQHKMTDIRLMQFSVHEKDTSLNYRSSGVDCPQQISSHGLYESVPDYHSTRVDCLQQTSFDDMVYQSSSVDRSRQISSNDDNRSAASVFHSAGVDCPQQRLTDDDNRSASSVYRSQGMDRPQHKSFDDDNKSATSVYHLPGVDSSQQRSTDDDSRSASSVYRSQGVDRPQQISTGDDNRSVSSVYRSSGVDCPQQRSIDDDNRNVSSVYCSQGGDRPRQISTGDDNRSVSSVYRSLGVDCPQQISTGDDNISVSSVYRSSGVDCPQQRSIDDDNRNASSVHRSPGVDRQRQRSSDNDNRGVSSRSPGVDRPQQRSPDDDNRSTSSVYRSPGVAHPQQISSDDGYRSASSDYRSTGVDIAQQKSSGSRDDVSGVNEDNDNMKISVCEKETLFKDKGGDVIPSVRIDDDNLTPEQLKDVINAIFVDEDELDGFEGFKSDDLVSGALSIVEDKMDPQSMDQVYQSASCIGADNEAETVHQLQDMIGGVCALDDVNEDDVEEDDDDGADDLGFQKSHALVVGLHGPESDTTSEKDQFENSFINDEESSEEGITTTTDGGPEYSDDDDVPLLHRKRAFDSNTEEDQIPRNRHKRLKVLSDSSDS